MLSRIPLTEEILKVNNYVLSLGRLVEKSLLDALEAFKKKDIVLAKSLKTNNVEIKKLQIQIDDYAAAIIATQQPVASDLRRLIAVFKLTSNLSRVGDYSSHLARTTIKVSEAPSEKQKDYLIKMVDLGCQMLRTVIEAFLKSDTQMARKAASLDEQVDEWHRKFVKEIVEAMGKRPKQIDDAVKLLKLSGFLERLGDHIKNISEAIVFMVEGKHIELD